MNTRSQLHRLTATALITISLATATAVAQTPAAPATSQPGSAMHSPMAGMGSGEMHRAMKAGMEKMGQMQMTGDIDKDFATMMRMHHQQAVDMAKIEVQKGKSAEMKALATKIIKDQQKEIGQLDKFLQKHK